ncbi:uncharacterized membrane protein YjjB (DUF3815 family) [Rhodanobacter sp. ANJX3]|uniref:DUF2878 domain-containing protein n=1 Tax=Rhodanobacter sp. ANJX3 TaxID=2723083 RepID=UPI001621278B|nr:DUF2878 domain-containing protein [Rhodanobacter sp. ANJX3]MBB5357157.1 uncharacterized membrane protein YjjB (DUF3815 family) [Rhodanobacter sp. ANJX3]
MKFWACLIGYQMVWFAAVIGAEHGLPWPGLVGMLIYASIQLSLTGHVKTHLSLMAAAIVMGCMVDGGLAYSGLAHYGAPWPSPSFAPLWIVSLWATFSLTFIISLAYLQKRLWVAVLFGAIGGPVAYMSASHGFHVVTFTDPSWRGLFFLGAGWAIATPILAWLSGRTPAAAPTSTARLQGHAS